MMFVRILFLSIGLELGVWADGKVFPPIATPVEVRIPDQRALLSWSNGVERLVIETRFTGQGTNFAWVVPLPAAPQVEAATPGLFPTLLHLMRPRVIHSPTNHWRLGLFLTGLLWLLITVRKDGRMRWMDWAAGAAMGVSVGSFEVTKLILGFVTFSAVTLVTGRVRRQGMGFWELMGLALVFFFGVLGFVGFLPALAKAGAEGPGGSVEILDRQLAGVFESTTITGRDPAALRGWFETNGYHLPPDTEPVIGDYLRDGWVFVASRVRRDLSESTPASLHPLSFTFAAKAPVYPLRLTGVGNGDLEVDLFVFGPERATARGFRVKESRATWYPPPQKESWTDPHFDDQTLPVAHKELRVGAMDAPWVTRLQASLSPTEMREDSIIQWAGFEDARHTLYSLRGAVTSVTNWTVNLLGVAVICIAIGFRGMKWTGIRCAWVAGVAFGVALIATFIGVTALPVVPVTVENRFVRRIDANTQQHAVRLAIADELNTNTPVTLEAVRGAIRRGLPATLVESGKPRSDFRIREEDSPYNYSLRSRSNGVELLLYDGIGSAEVIALPE